VELPGLALFAERAGRRAHEIIVTRAPQDHILLLLVPPPASTATAKSAPAMAANGTNSGRPEEILAASGIENEAKTNPPRAVREEDDHPWEPEIRFPGAETALPIVTEDGRRGEIGRWLDDGAPSLNIPVRQPN
jgi:hypothetical protein